MTGRCICWFSCIKSFFQRFYNLTWLWEGYVCISIQFLLVICECYRWWLVMRNIQLLNLSKEPNSIFTFLIKSYTTFMGPNFNGKVAQKETLLLKRHDFRTRHQVVFFPQSQLQRDMLPCHTFGIIELTTQGVDCWDSQPKGCDVGAVT